MNKLYILCLFGLVVCVVYFYGEHVGYSKCKIQNYQNEINLIEQNTKSKRIINDKVYKTGVRDIRRILHDKYTIKE